MSTVGTGQRDAVGLTGSGLSGGFNRSIMSSQLLFSLVVMLVVGFVIFGDTEPRHQAFFYGGSLAILVSGAVSVIVPWGKVDRRLVTAIPLIDVVAAGFMHLGMPDVATGLLWVFPVMWLGAYLTTWAMVTGLALAFSFIVINAFVTARRVTVDVIPDWIVLPLVLILVAVASSSSAKRVTAQRSLQIKQSQLLAKALARARSQEVLMSEILDAVSFGIMRLSADGEITLINRTQEQFERIRGADDDIFDFDGVSRLTPDTHPRVQAMNGESFTDRVIWYGRAERERVALAVSAIPLRSSAMPQGDVLMVYRDITEQLNAIRARDDLLSSVSHELRTPLTSMIGYVELVLEEDTLERNAKRQLEIAQRNGERLLDLISQILEASRGDSLAVALEPEEADLAHVVRQSVESQQLRASERGIRIDVSKVRTCVAQFDQSRIRQVVDNMLSNAIKYNRDYGLVTIDVDDFPSEVAVRITDTGFGVTPEELPKVFDRHFRSERVRNSTIHGNGLGLSISREIARQHGGELEMVSTSGEGSTIMLVLPKDGPPAPVEMNEH